ncbi:MAG TPA: hypothetical protein VF406_21695 [Thermodesulfobacteriota bacterium]
MRPLASHCHAGLGRLHRRAGDAVQAERHVALASALLRDMGIELRSG